ncbi:MAG TPA: hypothetical protein VMU38_02985 [Candidatus Binatia bacterium]|nr:hypothetical protein [Candidatus Binatia bacterium]
MALGTETFTAPGAPWVPQEWLFSLAVAAAWNHRLFLALSIAISLIPLWILASVYLRARRDASFEAIGIALLFCGIALLESFGARAQVLGWGALALFMLCIERRDRWYYAAFPAAILWANVHASVALAPAIVLTRLAATIVDDGFRLRVSRDLMMLPAVVVATFCTPLGWRLPYLALTMIGSPIRHYIQEWQPPGLQDASFLYGALPLAIAILLGGASTLIREKRRSFPAALLFAAALFAFRNTALFAIVAAPLAAQGLSARFPRLYRLGDRARELEPAAFAGIAIAVALAAIALVRAQQRGPARLPTAAVATIAADRAGHRIFCENFTWCSIALGYPRLRVFIDGRCDAYPIPVWQQYVSTIAVRRAWSEPLKADGVDFVVAQRGSGLARALAKTPHWGRTYDDASYVVFHRD